MSKANKKALDWLPKRKDGRKRYYQCNDDDIRSIYAKGYRKAEKDLELTWEDIADILDITDVIANDDSMEERLKTMSEEEYCQEVLKRFNKERKDGSKR